MDSIPSLKSFTVKVLHFHDGRRYSVYYFLEKFAVL